MGQDMVIGSLYIRGNAPIKQVADTIQWVEDNFEEEDWEDFADDRGILLPEEEDYSKQLKQNILGWLKTFGDCLDSRETVVFTFGNTCLYLSGGMSFGDSPTDASDYLYLAYELPESIQKMMGIVDGLDAMDYLMDEYENKLPDKLKQDIKDWNIARRI